MKATAVRCQVKPERAAENRRLIEAVFAELADRDAGLQLHRLTALVPVA